MALYALGDMHLSFSVDKPMDIFDPVWKDHEKKIEKYWRNTGEKRSRRRIRSSSPETIPGEEM